MSSTVEYEDTNVEQNGNEIIHLANRRILIDHTSENDTGLNRRTFCGITIKKEMDLLKMVHLYLFHR